MLSTAAAANRAIYLMTKPSPLQLTDDDRETKTKTSYAALSPRDEDEDERKSEILIDSPRTASDSTDPISLSPSDRSFPSQCALSRD